jgi:hypothetical protein
MTSVFKETVPKEIMYTLLDKIAHHNSINYIIDSSSYKKMKYENLHEQFLKDIVDYYHFSKRYYVERNFSYNSFMTILRQICKINNIQFFKNIKYNNSKHYIEYFVELPK